MTGNGISRAWCHLALAIGCASFAAAPLPVQASDSQSDRGIPGKGSALPDGVEETRVFVAGEPVLTGTVESLIAGRLLLELDEGGSRSIGRDRLLAIVFAGVEGGVAIADPPVLDPSDDVVVTTTGDAIAARIEAITADQVVTSARPFARAEVDRLLFGHPPDRSPILVDQGPAEGSVPELPEQFPEPDVPDLAPEPAPAGAGCPEDEPLGGRVSWSFETNYPSLCQPTQEITGWFTIGGPAPGTSAGPYHGRALVGRDLHLSASKSACRYQVQSLACSQLAESWSGEPADAKVLFEPTVPDLIVGFGWQSPTVVETCREKLSGASWSSDRQLLHTEGLRVVPASIQPRAHMVANVPPGPRPLPFRGSSETTTPTAMYKRSSVSWEICCGCGERPSGGGVPIVPEPPEEDAEDCFQTARLNQEWFDAQFEAVKAELGELLPQFEHHYNETLFNLEAWRFINAACGLTDVALKIVEHLLGKGSDYAEAILKGRQFAEKLSSDSGTWVIPGGLGEVVDLFGEIVEAYRAQFGDGSALRARLQSCQGMKTAFPKAYEAARQFLHHRERAHELASKLRRELQKLERLEIDYELETDKYHRACVQCAERQGLDPALCP